MSGTMVMMNMLKLWFDSFVMLFLSSQLGNTALHIAAGAGYQAVVKLLMEYGASPLIENKVWHSQELS